MMKKFRRPSMEQVRLAMGENILEKVARSSRIFMSDFATSQCFNRIPIPRRGDWLACHDERGQTFKNFKRFVMCAKPHASYRTIYIQPIGKFTSNKIVPLGVIREFMLCFFDTLDCEVLPVHTLKKANSISQIETRALQGYDSDNNVIQLKTKSVIKYLEMTKKRRNTRKQKERFRKEIVTIGITYPYDLYPDDDWNFVFGIAHICDGLGVYSFARFDPDFPELEDDEEEAEGEGQISELVLKRSLRTVAHEVGHLFGLKHCIYFHCIMNGSNHQTESDSHPLFLCPVCLLKIFDSIGCDLKARYVKMYKFFKKYRMVGDSEWIKKRFLELNFDIDTL